MGVEYGHPRGPRPAEANSGHDTTSYGLNPRAKRSPRLTLANHGARKAAVETTWKGNLRIDERYHYQSKQGTRLRGACEAEYYIIVGLHDARRALARTRLHRLDGHDIGGHRDRPCGGRSKRTQLLYRARLRQIYGTNEPTAPSRWADGAEDGAHFWTCSRGHLSPRVGGRRKRRTGLLAAIALVSYVWVYTPMKQLSPWAFGSGQCPGPCHLYSADCGTQTVEWPGLVLFGIMFIWQLPHFIAISMYRDSEYQRAGIRTVTAVHGWSSSIRQIFFWTAVLVPFSLLLVPLNITGTIYMASAGVLGFIFVVKAMQGFREKDASLWARSLFLYSLVYLTLLFAAVAVDVLIARG